eukprot:m.241211 g.241211  ORF g.241211 m.241211 type:complete len:80 (-) comp18860_c0_seq1:28-267(-)
MDNGDDKGVDKQKMGTFMRGMAAGLVLAHFNKQLVLGALVGSLAGAFYHQEYGLPDIMDQYRETKESVEDIIEKADNSK